MVVIRLARSGAKKRPFYHIVAADKRDRRDGRFIERLGYFNPVATGQDTGLSVNLDRIEYWLSVGAQSSDRVTQLLKKNAKEAQATQPAPKASKSAPKAEKSAPKAEKPAAKKAAPKKKTEAKEASK